MAFDGTKFYHPKHQKLALANIIIIDNSAAASHTDVGRFPHIFPHFTS
jgi:hypothetical protein